jgi:S1-C subfamily serine protease
VKKFFAACMPVSLVLTFVLAGCISTASANVSSPPAAPVVGATGISAPLSTSITGLEATLESIYTQTTPSVVNIEVSTNMGGALGSGFIWDTNGHIVTNNHVIAGATNISITFSDGTIVPGTLTGADLDSDLAVVKVNNVSPALLKPVTMADSTQLKVGQLAVAIGNPFGLQGTMTVGFISALGRLVPVDENAVGPTYNIPDIIQTDASLNPGNSGGVLLDSHGNVIGVTQSMSSTSGSSAGVGFAIPAALVQQVVPALIKTGHYDHPYLGLVMVSINPDYAAAMNLPVNQRGALVEDVTTGSPSEKAGLKPSTTSTTINGVPVMIGGDVIITFNNQVVKSSDDLITLLGRMEVGQTATLTVLRAGKQVQLMVVIGVRPGA